MNETVQHVGLLVQWEDGKPLREPVHAVQLTDGNGAAAPPRFRLLYSPGLVRGIAAGDEFELTDATSGAFVVRRRGGKLAVQLYHENSLVPFREELAAAVRPLGGTLDGAIDQGIVFTIPLSAGFRAIEALFNGWVRAHPGGEWYYGNVYDPRDGVTPLGWWNEPPFSNE